MSRDALVVKGKVVDLEVAPFLSDIANATAIKIRDTCVTTHEHSERYEPGGGVVSFMLENSEEAVALITLIVSAVPELQAMNVFVDSWKEDVDGDWGVEAHCFINKCDCGSIVTEIHMSVTIPLSWMETIAMKTNKFLYPNGMDDPLT